MRGGGRSRSRRSENAPSAKPQGNERGAMGSKNPPCILEPLFLQHQTLPLGSKIPFPLCHCLVGRCLRLLAPPRAPAGDDARSARARRRWPSVGGLSIYLSLSLSLSIYIYIYIHMRRPGPEAWRRAAPSTRRPAPRTWAAIA